ncbi:MAG: YfhO family protein [Lachnospiraceae bacterium]|nr:YfhO family protein [Lachnospiraceae bacterium]
MRKKTKLRAEDILSGKKIYLIYSAAFVLMCAVIFRWFYGNGRSFVWSADGWSQHFKALIYYAEWMRNVVRELFVNHTLNIPTFSFSIGYGSDILTTLHYYAIGDPLNLFSIFVPTGYMVYFYEFLILLRLYLAGLCFMKFCFYVRGRGTGALAGAFTWVFCGYALFASMRHPYFINPMIYLPLVLLGVEKLLREKKPVCLILSVFLSGVSNFYFFYAIVLLTVIYVVFRLVMIWHGQAQRRGFAALKKPLYALLQIAGCSVVGVLLSAAVLLPVILMFLGDARSASENAYDLFYQRSYYEKFLPSLISFRSMGNWTIMSYSAVVLPAIILLFLKKKSGAALKTGLLLLTGFLLLPVFGHIFNGFSYVSNRWIWGYAMLTAYILAVMWDELLSMTRKEICLLAAVYAGYAVICLHLVRQFESRRYTFFQLAVGAAAITVFAAVSEGKRRRRVADADRMKWLKLLSESLVLCLLLCSAGRNAARFYSEEGENYPADFLMQKSVNQRLDTNEGRALALLADGSFWRYTGPAVTRNTTLLNGLSNTQYYWSLANGAVAEFFKSLGVPEPLPYDCEGLDDRAMLNTLQGVRYYVASASKSEEALVPFGFEKVNLPEKSLAKKYAVYENSYALPLGYTYSGYLLRKDYDELPDAARQEAMLQALVVDEPVEDFAPVDPQLTVKSLPYEISFSSKNVSQQGNSFVVTKKGAYATLKFEEPEACETCLLLTGLSFEGVSPRLLYNDDKSIDPYDLFTQEAWDALSAKEQEQKEKAERDYREPTKLDISLVLTLADGSTITRTVPYRTPKYTWYNGVHDFQMNLGYHEQGSMSLRIKFPQVGIYRFEQFGIFIQPMEQYAALVEERREDVLEELDLHNDNEVFATGLVTGKISLEEPKLLCMAIPPSRGWTAYVDGEKQEIVTANIMSMALPLSAGEHAIRLEYRTPGLTAGLLCSIAGGCFLAGILLYRRRKNGHNNYRSPEQEG